VIKPCINSLEITAARKGLSNLTMIFRRSRLRIILYKTEERVALRKQGLNEKTAASVLLKLFISGNENQCKIVTRKGGHFLIQRGII